ncbi:MAG: hypothetical protein L3J96_04255, partial [Thermoplasmata archaeon]|nr:hypothetical protein [Thermoplasmata archaeon]
GEPICGLPWYNGLETTALLLTAFVVGPSILSWLILLRGTIQIEGDEVHIRSRAFVHWKIPVSAASGRPLGSSGDRIRLVVRATRFGIPVRIIDIDGPLQAEVRGRLLVRPSAET